MKDLKEELRVSQETIAEKDRQITELQKLVGDLVSSLLILFLTIWLEGQALD